MSKTNAQLLDELGAAVESSSKLQDEVDDLRVELSDAYEELGMLLGGADDSEDVSEDVATIPAAVSMALVDLRAAEEADDKRNSSVSALIRGKIACSVVVHSTSAVAKDYLVVRSACCQPKLVIALPETWQVTESGLAFTLIFPALV